MSQPPDRDFALLPDFEPVDVAAWRDQVEADLRGAPFEKRLVTHTLEGLDIQPLYTRDSTASGDFAGFPGFAPSTRGASPLGSSRSGWEVRQVCRLAEPAAANAALLDDLAKGAHSLRLEVADTPGAAGLQLRTGAELARALDGVDPTAAPVALAAGAGALPVAAALLAHWHGAGFDRAAVRAELGLDPLGELARSGQLDGSLALALTHLADAAVYSRQHWPGVRSVAVDTSPYHDAGANAVQELAVGLATGVAYLRALEAAGLAPDESAAQLVFRLRMGTRFFMGLSKLRAARRLWDRALEACQVREGARAMRLEVGLGARALTRRGPWVNLLRNTVVVFAGALGGADAIVCEPHDAALGPAGELSRRLARNAAIVLREESALGRVVDPAGGAWMIESLTAQLAEHAWRLFQNIERLGGMAVALESGWIADQLAATEAERERRVASRREVIVGVSDFADLDEPLPAVATTRGGRGGVDSAGRLDDPAARATPSAAPLAAVRSEVERLRGGAAPHGGLTASLVAAASQATPDELRALLSDAAGATRIAPLPARRRAGRFEELRDRSDAYKQRTGARPRVFLANLGPVAEHSARAGFARGLLEAGGLRAVSNDGFDDVEAVRAAFHESGAVLVALCSSDARYAQQAEPVARALREAGALAIVLAGRPGELEVRYRTAGVTHFMALGTDVVELLEALWRCLLEVVP